MTNEELASGIQQGTDHYGQLWERVCRLVYLLANRYYRNYQHPCRRAGCKMDDLIQTGFLAMCDAVKAFIISALHS